MVLTPFYLKSVHGRVGTSKLFASITRRSVRSTFVKTIPCFMYKSFSTRTCGMKPPLEGIRILDLSTVLAGPSCSMYLADLGAEVIKLEVPEKGDDSRNVSPPFTSHKSGVETWEESSSGRESSYFIAVNRNKRSITVNLKTSEGIELAKKLVASSDVLLENQIAGKLDKLGLGYEAVKKVRPDIIYCSITGYGQTGPYKTFPGYDAIIGADSGVLNTTGENDRPPVRPGVPISDLAAGFNATISILAALIGRSRNTEGAYIDISMFDTQVAALGNVASSWLNGLVETERFGTGHPTVVPYQVFETKDGYVMIGTGNNSQFARLVSELGRPEWKDDARYVDNSRRVSNRAELVSSMTSILRTKTSKEWTEKFNGKGFPFGSVNNMQQAFEHPQAIAREVAMTIPHKLTGEVTVVVPAVIYNGKRMKIRNPPPGLGEDTKSVLREIGISDEQVADLKSRRTV